MAKRMMLATVVMIGCVVFQHLWLTTLHKQADLVEKVVQERRDMTDAYIDITERLRSQQ